jgi:hypothetical protein
LLRENEKENCLSTKAKLAFTLYNGMGAVHAEITLKNVKDESIALETVTAVVDTGAISLVITEKLR